MQSDVTDTAWRPCPEGELGRMVRRQQQQRRRWMVGRAASVVAVVMITATAVAGYTLISAPDQLQQLTCSEAVEYMSRYRGGVLNASTAKQVADHLEKCPACRRHYDQVLEQEAPTASVRRGARHAIGSLGSTQPRLEFYAAGVAPRSPALLVPD